MDFPGGSAGKESACNLGDLGSIPGLERSPWRRERLPTPVFWNFPYAFIFDPWGRYACVHAKSLQSCLSLWDPMDCSPPASSFVGFSRQEYWSGLPCPPPGHLPDPGIRPTSLLSPALAGEFFTTGTTWESQNGDNSYFMEITWGLNNIMYECIDVRHL